jgi:hypothetical protein
MRTSRPEGRERQMKRFKSPRQAQPPLQPADAMADRRHGIDRFFEEAAVVDVCCGEPDGERDAPGVNNERALGAGSADTLRSYRRILVMA